MLGINKVLAFVRRQVGLRTDAASATGSLHAKTKDIKNTMLANRSAIKSIQRGSVIITNKTATNITINSVVMEKSFVLIDSSSTSIYGMKGELTSQTNLMISTGYTDASGSSMVAWQIIEFY